MRALLIYDDLDCAANANAILRRAGHRANETIRWDVRPWRLDLFAFPLTVEQALGDAVNAHLILFAVRRASPLPPALIEWLEQWILFRRIADAAVAFVGDGTHRESSVAALELARFARRHDLSFIEGNHGGIVGQPADVGGGLDERRLLATRLQPPVWQVPSHIGYRNWGLND